MIQHFALMAERPSVQSPSMKNYIPGFTFRSSVTLSFFFFFNDTATTEIYTLSLHDALPIFLVAGLQIGSVNSSAVWIRYSPGGVRLQDCTIVGADNASATCSDGWRGVEIESSTNVALTLCSLHGGRGGSASGCWQVGPGAEALYAHASSVALHECVLQGGPGGAGVFMGAGWTQSSQGGNGGAGCSLQDGFVFASGATIRAGDGGQGGPGAGTCLGTAHGCGGTGGDAVVVNGAAPPDPIVVLLGTGLVRGSGGASGSPNLCFGPPCPGPDGVQIRAPAGAVSQIPGPSRELTASSVARENTVVPLTFHGVPGDHVWLYFARRPTFSYNAPFHGVNLTPVPPLA